jgi:phosphoribosylaminoimidazole-succinocarboxamide synthase
MIVLMESDLKGKTLFRRGKVRDVYAEDGELLIVATDRISAFDRVMPKGVPEKGSSLTRLSEFWFLKTNHIFKNHFISRVDERTIRVRKAERISIEWIARAYLYGSAWRSYSKGAREISGVKLPSGLRLAEELPEIVLTPTTKSEHGHDQELSRKMAVQQGLVDPETWNELEEATFHLFEFYKREAKSKGIIIPDFKLEFGRLGDDLIQIDEPPTHDSARFWALDKYKVGEKQEKHCLDKEFLRDFLLRKGFSGDGEIPELPDLVIDQISKRCKGAHSVLSQGVTLESLALLSIDEVLSSLDERSHH